MGSRAFYAWADGEPRIALVDSRLAHDARALAALPRFVAINSGLQVDLLGNVNSTVHRGRRISGPGGAPDFAAAGARGAGSIVALLSTTPDGRSAIVREAEAITVPGAHVTHVVTEHGAACLVGLSAHERAGAIAAVADPAFRDALSG
jgi:acyl-CoA hydrolase